MANYKPISPKQKRFADEWLKDMNGKQAVLRAGYSKTGAEVTANRLLMNPNVKEYLDLKRGKLSNKLEISQERVLLELSRIAFTDIRDYYDESGALKDIKKLSDDAAAALSGVEEGDILFGGRKIKRFDKLRAIENICKILGYNAPEKSEVLNKNLNVNLEMSKEERAEIVNALKSSI